MAFKLLQTYCFLLYIVSLITSSRLYTGILSTLPACFIVYWLEWYVLKTALGKQQKSNKHSRENYIETSTELN
mgnify:CR=1 FL=1